LEAVVEALIPVVAVKGQEEHQPLVVLAVVVPVKSVIATQSTLVHLAPMVKVQKEETVPPMLGLVAVAVAHRQQAQTVTA
jgi:hypothetical protein